jgi:ABC-type multidrug transport system fused ATPase/permease subunit
VCPFRCARAAFSTASKTAASLLSTTAFGLGLDILAAYEDEGQGVTFANATVFIRNYSMATALGMMAFDFILYGVLAWYADAVLPSRFREFGVPRVWYFPCTRAYWREVFNLPPEHHRPAGSDHVTVPIAGPAAAAAKAAEAPHAHAGTTDPRFIEEPDSTLRAREADGRCVSSESWGGRVKGGGATCRMRVRPPAPLPRLGRPMRDCRSGAHRGRVVVCVATCAVRGLRKEFDTPDGIKVAVAGVDMTMYEGQIFALLGHNGAGKTTVINMLTGMLPPSSGTMAIWGRDAVTELAAIRRDLGVCPQHDGACPAYRLRTSPPPPSPPATRLACSAVA